MGSDSEPHKDFAVLFNFDLFRAVPQSDDNDDNEAVEEDDAEAEFDIMSMINPDN